MSILLVHCYCLICVRKEYLGYIILDYQDPEKNSGCLAKQVEAIKTNIPIICEASDIKLAAARRIGTMYFFIWENYPLKNFNRGILHIQTLKKIIFFGYIKLF